MPAPGSSPRSCGQARGSLPEDAGSGNDNLRIKRYIAKYTINPAKIFGIDHEIGSIERGKLADLVFWKPAMFGVKPELVLKSGFPAWAVTGEANASLMVCEPLLYRPQWGSFGRAARSLSVRFVSPLALEAGMPGRLGLESRCVATRSTRGLSKHDMVLNDALPDIRVNADTYRVSIDGEDCLSGPAGTVPLGSLYMMK